MSRRTYDLTAAARLDLLDVWNYLAENASLRVADKVARDIENAIRAVVRNPHRGHRRPDLTDRDVLFFRVHSYLVIYRPETTPLQVVRVLHSARDVSAQLRD